MEDQIIYVMRHGKYGGDGCLVEKGIEEVKETAKKLKEELNNLEKRIIIYTSPKKRARETAEILAREISDKIEKVEVREELECENYEVKKLEDKFRNDRIIILVGHKPDLEDYLEEKGIYAFLGTAEYVKIKNYGGEKNER